MPSTVSVAYTPPTELKHYQGLITGNAYRWQRGGRSEDSPLLLARRKAQRLKGVIIDALERSSRVLTGATFLTSSIASSCTRGIVVVLCRLRTPPICSGSTVGSTRVVCRASPSGCWSRLVPVLVLG